MINLITVSVDEPNLPMMIRDAAMDRCVIRVPEVSAARWTQLAGQIGELTDIIQETNLSSVVGDSWPISADPIYQRGVGSTPVLELSYCVRPSGFVRWFTDLTEVFPHYPSDTFDAWFTAEASYTEHRGVERGRLIRLAQTSRPYAVVTDSLREIDGATPKQVADLIATMRNIYWAGTNEIYLDQPGDLYVHYSDGIAVGRYPGVTPGHGHWIHASVSVSL